MKRLLIGLSIILAIAIVGASVSFVWKKARSVRQELREHAASEEAKLPAASHSAIPSPGAPSVGGSATAPGKSSPPSIQRDPESLWRPFQQLYGENLKAEFLPTGFLASLKGSRGNAGGPHGIFRNFKPEDSVMVTTRAQEIVEAASSLLGIQPESPLGAPVVRGNEISAQVTFHEMHNALPVSPGGLLTLDLGAQGEIIGLYSSYVHDITLLNHRVLTEEQAREKANTAITESKTVINVEPGTPLIWIAKKAEASQPAQGYFAYEFIVHGFLVIVNAEDGSTLLKRDQRQY